MSQSKTSRSKAVKALKKCNGDIVNAIMVRYSLFNPIKISFFSLVVGIDCLRIILNKINYSLNSKQKTRRRSSICHSINDNIQHFFSCFFFLLSKDIAFGFFVFHFYNKKRKKEKIRPEWNK